MLVDNNVYKKTYKGNGDTIVFPIPFPFLENEHVQVVRSVDGATESIVPASEYTITGAGVEAGGTCTFKVAPSAGITIVVMRNVPITQLYAYRELDNFPAESHENALAKLTMIDQQQQEQLNRALKVPSVSSQTPEELMTELFQIRDDSQAAQSAAEAAQSAAETCRDEACECASKANATLESAITVIKEQEQASIESVQQQEQASVEIVKNEGDEQAKRLEDIATTILISAASYNKSVSVKLTSPITNGETYTLPESMAYLVGRSQLYVSGNGVWFYKNYQYEEVGTDGVASTQIKFLQDLAVDDVLTFTFLANRVNVLTATNSGLINDADGYLKLNVDEQTVLINASGQVYVPVMVGATGDKAGTAGLVPGAAAGKQDKPLTGGGKYADSLDCDITGHASKDLPLTGGTVTGGIYPKKAQLPLGSVSNFWNIYAKYIEFITEDGASVGNFNAFEYEGRHILGLYPNTDVGAQIHLGSDTQPLEKVHVNRLNGCWGDDSNVSIEKPDAIHTYGAWGDAYSGGFYMRFTSGNQIVVITYANGASGQDVWMPFPVPFKDTNYAAICMPLVVSSNTMSNAGVTNRQTTGCNFATQFGSGVYNLAACGIFLGWY